MLPLKIVNGPVVDCQLGSSQVASKSDALVCHWQSIGDWQLAAYLLGWGLETGGWGLVAGGSGAMFHWQSFGDWQLAAWLPGWELETGGWGLVTGGSEQGP